jgi:NAD(P)-dependent dehydrogenase (short-subunit alcohol dehydrogenase family)
VRLLEGKVALVTGAARGMGRSHAVRLAEEGASIIAVDICLQIDSVPCPMATQGDLAETAEQVQACGSSVVTRAVDARDHTAIAGTRCCGQGAHRRPGRCSGSPRFGSHLLTHGPCGGTARPLTSPCR